MKNSDGKLLTSKKDIIDEAVRHYKKVFENKPIDKELQPHQQDRETLCNERLKSAFENKTPSWTISDVRTAINSLNMGISKDPYGHPNEYSKKV